MFVYILASKNRSLYVGVTNDLGRLVYEHGNETVAGSSKGYGMKRLVYYESLSGLEQAIRREKQIKGYTRAKKLALIDSMNPGWDDLARSDFLLRSR